MELDISKSIFVGQLTRALVEFRKRANESTGQELDVRLHVEPADQNWWLTTGDVQYDTCTADLCAAGMLRVSMTNDEVIQVANDLLADIASQAAEQGE